MIRGEDPIRTQLLSECDESRVREIHWEIRVFLDELS